MTEDEAKTKWCPMVRHALWIAGEKCGGNEPEVDSQCIASECMMWRTVWRPDEVKGDHYTVNEVGYCGLAGKP